VKVVEIDLDSDDEEEQRVRRTATAEAVGAMVQEERDENMQTPIRVIQTPAKERRPRDSGEMKRVRKGATQLERGRCPRSGFGRTWRRTRRGDLRDLRSRLKKA
jgi:hypothetical protein